MSPHPASSSPPPHSPAAHPLRSSLPSPRARLLGYAGLLPFVLGATLVWVVNEEAHPHALAMLTLYAAVIVSFLGGIHWGLAMQAATEGGDARLLWGVVPSLMAWVGALMTPDAGLVVQGAALIACYVVDRQAYPTWGAAGWLTLRFRLTAVASLSCFLGAAGA